MPLRQHQNFHAKVPTNIYGTLDNMDADDDTQDDSFILLNEEVELIVATIRRKTPHIKGQELAQLITKLQAFLHHHRASTDKNDE
jgi:hypothetical protein